MSVRELGTLLAHFVPEIEGLTNEIETSWQEAFGDGLVPEYDLARCHLEEATGLLKRLSVEYAR
jgi:hypothetical protein